MIEVSQEENTTEKTKTSTLEAAENNVNIVEAEQYD